MATNSKSTVLPSSTRPCRILNSRTVQGFHLVWLNVSIDENNDDCNDCLTKLRQVVSTVNTFIDIDECIDFITDYTEEKVFMVISEEFTKNIAPVAQNISQVSSMYIYCRKQALFETWVQQWPKIKGVYADVTSICEALQQATYDYEQNLVAISIINIADGTTPQKLDQLDPSFMYTQILKEILLTIKFNRVHFDEFITYCREQFVDDSRELKNVDKMKEEYSRRSPIWWYTCNSFLYSMVNKALRTMEVDPIVKLGFFIQDLHSQITTLHSEQYGEMHDSNSFTVYRGQGLSQTDFERLKAIQGGLLAFNAFVSTSQNPAISVEFARRSIVDSDLIGVLFVIKIDPTISTTPFANVKKTSCYQREEEILFTMHSVYRIRQVQQIEKNGRLWQVDLTLTSDNDPQLQTLTKIMNKDIKGQTEWHRLGVFMTTIAQFDKAEELYTILLKQTTNEREQGYLFHLLGLLKNAQGKYNEAAAYNEKAILIHRKTFPPDDPTLAIDYSNIGLVYYNVGDHSKALLYFEKAIEIQQKKLPSNHRNLGCSYGNIGLVYDDMGEYFKALSSYQKALEIQQKTLPANHPTLASICHNIGQCYDKIGEYSKALSYSAKALEIDQKTLPGNHPDLGRSYNNIGRMYHRMREYSKALSSCEKAVEIYQKALPANHPDLAISHNDIGAVYQNMGEYSKALSCYEKAFEMLQKTLPTNHPLLGISYSNIGGMYYRMGEYSKALSYYEHALNILRQGSLPSDHPYLQDVKENIEILKKYCK